MMDVKDIQKLLAHRYPFLLVDRVTEIDVGRKLVAYKNVTINEEFFNGHFPGHPVMPGVLQLEALAQACALLAYKSTGLNPDDLIIYLMSIDNAKFQEAVEATRTGCPISKLLKSGADITVAATLK